MGLRILPIQLCSALIFCVLVIVNGTIAQGGGGVPSFILQPVQPKTVPFSFYPPGTVIVGQEIILGSVPARVWLEVRVTGWEPEPLKTVQARIAATDDDVDGGGYFGQNADCLGASSVGAGNLTPAMQPCTINADCRATMSGRFVGCGVGEPSRCLFWNGVTPGDYFPPGNYCEPSFQDKCDPEWLGSGIANSAAVDQSNINVRLGMTAFPGEVVPDFHPSYVGTLVIDVPADAKGSYTIDFDETQTYMQSPTVDGLMFLDYYPAKITVPCGRCCYGYISDDPQCADHVTQIECSDPGDQIFIPNESCPAETDCPVCLIDPNCDDGLFCNGHEVCGASRVCGPGGTSPCQPYEECDEAADECRPRIPAVSTWGLVVLALGILIIAKKGTLTRQVRAN